MERSLEVSSSLQPWGAMLSPRDGATSEGSESSKRSEKSMHDMHRGRHPRCVVGANSTSQSQSIRSSVAALARLSKALFIACMLYVRRTAAGDAFNVEYRVMNDADHALRCGRLLYVAMLAHGALPALLAVTDGHLSRCVAHGR